MLHRIRKSTPPALTGVLCALGLSMSLGAAAAEDSPTDLVRLTAEVDTGVALRRDGKDDQALEAFQRAEQMTDSPPVRLLVHLAAVHQALGNWEQADSYLTKVFENRQDPYFIRHRQTLTDARARVALQLGTLDVRGTPEGAEVFLNGESRGTLPLRKPLRVTAGVYNLEIRHPGYYPITRSIALAGGAVTRETLTLAEASEPPAAGPANAIQPRVASPTPWLGWTFAGLSLASATASTFAWRTRESHAERWNDDSRCLIGELSRSQSCDDELQSGKTAETWMYVGLAATSAFAIGAAIEFATSNSDPMADRASLDCAMGPFAVRCGGHF